MTDKTIKFEKKSARQNESCGVLKVPGTLPEKEWLKQAKEWGYEAARIHLKIMNGLEVQHGRISEKCRQ